MAKESVLRIKESADPTWQPSHASESPLDRAQRKLRQAEALAHCLIGDLEDPFENCNDVLRQDVRQLLADTITEAREAYNQAHARELA